MAKRLGALFLNKEAPNSWRTCISLVKMLNLCMQAVGTLGDVQVRTDVAVLVPESLLPHLSEPALG